MVLPTFFLNQLNAKTRIMATTKIINNNSTTEIKSIIKKCKFLQKKNGRPNKGVGCLNGWTNGLSPQTEFEITFEIIRKKSK